MKCVFTKNNCPMINNNSETCNNCQILKDKKKVEKTETERLLLAQAISGQVLLELMGKMTYSKKMNFSLDNLIKRSISVGRDTEITKKEINDMLDMTMREFYEMTLMKLAQSKFERDQEKAENKLMRQINMNVDKLSKNFLKTIEN